MIDAEKIVDDNESAVFFDVEKCQFVKKVQKNICYNFKYKFIKQGQL